MPEVKPEKIRRFDYIRFDETHQQLQNQFYTAFNEMADCIEEHLPNGRAKSLSLTKLEESYSWVGKQIRDNQILMSERVE